MEDLFDNKNSNKEIQKKSNIIKVKKLCKSQNDIKKIELTT